MYVARMHVGGCATDQYCASEDLEIVRAWIMQEAVRQRQGAPYRFPRHPNDDPAVYEAWL
jgi:hypothetical protein